MPQNSVEARTRVSMGVFGSLLSTLVILSPYYLPGKILVSMKSLYVLSSVSALVLSSYLLGEALFIAPAIFEVFFGFLASMVGIKPVEIVEMLALIGSVTLMFSAGTEIELRLLLRHLHQSLAIGSISFLVPLAATTLALEAMGYPLRQAVAAGVGVSTTSVAVVYALVRSGGRLDETKQVILASTMVVDLLSVVALVIVVAEANLEILGFYIAALLVLPPLMAWIFRAIPRSLYEAEIRLIMAVLLAVALFSEIAGIHAVLFAFILGMAVSDAVRAKPGLAGKVSGIVFGFLSPIFFINAGLEVEVSMITGNPLVVPVVFIVPFVFKILATYAGLRLFLGIRDWKWPLVFSARLTVSILIAYTGYVKGLIDGSLAAAIMLTALLATITAGVAAGRHREVGEAIEEEEEALIPINPS